MIHWLILWLASTSQSISEEAYAPPIKRSATDSLSIKIKRERDEEVPARPKKHPRRTLSEQIIIHKTHDLVKSPKSPAPERVHKALQDRIEHLKQENADLKDECADQKDHIANLEDVRDEMRRDMGEIKARLADLEREVSALRMKSHKD